MSADKFLQLSDAFLKISQGFAEVASIMGSNFEPSGLSATSIPVVAPVSNAVVVTEEIASVEPVAKKVKKEKDPNAPKRPLNAYFLFQRDYRPKLKVSNPELSFVEVNKLINEAWEKMSPEERGRYEGEAKGLYEEYAKEILQYSKGQQSKDSVVVDEMMIPNAKAIESQQHHEFIANSELAYQTASSDDVEPIKKKKKKKNRELESSGPADQHQNQE